MAFENSFLLEIFQDLFFSPKQEKTIASKFEKLTLKKGTLLLKTNEIVHNQYYVYNGCLRTYFIDPYGKEHTIQFAIKDWWISDYTAFFSTEKAIMNIEVIKDATLYKISKKNIDTLYQDVPILETFFRKKMERAFGGFQKRIVASLALSAKERYISFINTYPNIQKSVKNYHIASYLGVTTESLSRIRKELTNQ